MPYEKQNKLHIVTAVAVVRRGDGRILLLKRRDDETVYPGFYTFPGGKIEGNETIHQGLIKEVKEECGLKLNSGFILIKEKAIGRPDGQTSKSLSFLCTAKNPDEVVLDTGDFTDYIWVNLDELRKLKHVGIEAEFIRVEIIYSLNCDLKPFFTDTDQVDNGGAYLTSIAGTTAGDIYMIGTDTTDCNTYTCDVTVTSLSHCVDLAGLVTEGYLGSVPVSPNGVGSWTAGHTGYALSRATTGVITVYACESENAASISVSR